MDINQILDMTLEEVTTLDDNGYLPCQFTYEMETNGTYKYECEYVMPGYIHGDPNGYGTAYIDVPSFIKINIFCDDVIFACGYLEFDPEEYENEYLEERPEQAAMNYADYWIEKMYGEGEPPDGVIVTLLNSPCDLPGWYEERYPLDTTIRQLFAESKMFELNV